MITGFNRPTCTRSTTSGGAAQRSRRLLGIGEFTIHKEFVVREDRGETASLTNPALDRILDFAGEVGLVVILHSDVDMPFRSRDRSPTRWCKLAQLLEAHPKTTVIWAHWGSAASSTREGPDRDRQARAHEPRAPAVYFDISWTRRRST